jgi:hypothetical protein
VFTDSVAPVIYFITRLHGPSRNTVSKSTSVVACVSVTSGTSLPSRCLETNVGQSRSLATAVSLAPQFLH